MTIDELYQLVKQIQAQVELNTLAVQSISNQLNTYTPLSQFYNVNNKVNGYDATLTDIANKVATLSLDLSKVNKLSAMLDTNIKNAAIDDILQFDGDRWTNVKASGIVGGGGVNKLEDLSDVRISNKLDKQSLVWDNTTSKWINYTVSSGGGGEGGGLDVTAMWQELAKADSSKTIDPSHITGFVQSTNGTATNLTVNTLTTSGNVRMTNGSKQLSLTTSGVSVNGDLTSTGEITAYKLA